MKPLTPDDIDRELQQRLTVEPSPDFVARVRTTIASGPTHAGVRGIYIGLAASVAAAALLIALGASFTRPAIEEATASIPHRSEVVVRTPVPDPVAASPPAKGAPTRRIPASGTRARAQREPRLEVIIPPDELRALERLARSTAEGTIALSFDERDEKLAISELSIAPITTKPLVISEQQGVVQ